MMKTAMLTLSMLLVLVLFNYPAIILEPMIATDYSRSIDDYSGLNILTAWIERGIPVATIINNLIFAYIVPFSAVLGRLVIVIAGMLPLSLLWTIIASRFLGLPLLVSAIAGLWPQILPNQTDIPAHINGSYETFALIPSFLFVYFVSAYAAGRRDRMTLFLVYICLALSLVSTELSYFVVPPAAVLVFLLAGFNRTVWKNLSGLVPVLGLGLLNYAMATHDLPNAVSPPTLGHLLERLRDFVSATSPLPASWAGPWAQGLVLLAILAFPAVFIFQKRRTTSAGSVSVGPEPEKRSPAHVLIFGLTWMVCTGFPFVALTAHSFSPRYGYAAGFGSSLSIVYLTYLAVNRWMRQSIVTRSLWLALTLLLGLAHAHAIRETYRPSAPIHQKIKTFLLQRDYPPIGQIVIVGRELDPLYTCGIINCSTGYIRYVLHRSDLFGLIGPRLGFYNPFKQWSADWEEKMLGLSIEAPLFLYSIDPDGSIRQHTYALLWEDDLNWTLLKVNPSTGSLHTFLESRGNSSYQAVRKTLPGSGISLRDVFWDFDLPYQPKSVDRSILP